MKQPETRDKHHLIVGAGIAGCALAYALSARGQQVTVLERGTLTKQGASSVPIALLNPHRGRSGRAQPYDLAGLAAMHDLADELERQQQPAGIFITGVLRIASTSKQANKWRKLDGITWLDADQLPSSYHCPYGAFLVPAGGWVRPQVLLTSLITASCQRGAQLKEHCQVDKLEPHAHHYHVHTNQNTLTADVVHLCVGADTHLADYLPEEISERLAGDVIGLSDNTAGAASTTTMPYPIAGAVYGAKDAQTSYIGGNHRPAGETDPEAARLLQKSASWFVPSLHNAELVSTWTGVRAKQEGGKPLVTEVAPNMWFLGALAGRGFLCAYAEARALAETLT
jgi:glycine/D-amino acid oxidase-like deaminating enzyme